MFDLMLREMERLEGNLFGSYNHLNFEPSYNVSEDEGVYTLSFLLPGLDAGDIEIVYEDSVLTVRGERKASELEGEEVAGDNNGKFEHSLRFRVAIDPASVSASYKDGVLLIKANKLVARKPININVN